MSQHSTEDTSAPSDRQHTPMFYDAYAYTAHGFLAHVAQCYTEEKYSHSPNTPCSILSISLSSDSDEHTSANIAKHARHGYDTLVKLDNRTYVLFSCNANLEIATTIARRITYNTPDAEHVILKTYPHLPALPQDYTESHIARALISLEQSLENSLNVYIHNTPPQIETKQEEGTAYIPHTKRLTTLLSVYIAKIPDAVASISSRVSIYAQTVASNRRGVQVIQNIRGRVHRNKLLAWSAYTTPIVLFTVILLYNYHPLGFEKTYTLDIGSETDTELSEMYLEPSRYLSEREVAENESEPKTTYRTLSGLAYIVFSPTHKRTGAPLTAYTGNDAITIIPPYFEVDAKNISWDVSWDFRKGDTPEAYGLDGSAFPFDNTMYFNDSSRLILPASASNYEEGPFSIYVEWGPRDSEHNGQQIIGHYNWELWQNARNIEFRVGRMNDANGPIHSITYQIPDPETFFRRNHSAVAVYNPSENGYVTLYVDNIFAGRVQIKNSVIWKEYGNENLSFGWTPHNWGNSPHYIGNLYFAAIARSNIISEKNEVTFRAPLDVTDVRIPIVSNGAPLDTFTLHESH